jgi:hypothetical protein
MATTGDAGLDTIFIVSWAHMVACITHLGGPCGYRR